MSDSNKKRACWKKAYRIQKRGARNMEKKFARKWKWYGFFQKKNAGIFDELSDALFVSAFLVNFSNKSPLGRPLLVLVSIVLWIPIPLRGILRGILDPFCGWFWINLELISDAGFGCSWIHFSVHFLKKVAAVSQQPPAASYQLPYQPPRQPPATNRPGKRSFCVINRLEEVPPIFLKKKQFFPSYSGGKIGSFWNIFTTADANEK